MFVDPELRRAFRRFELRAMAVALVRALTIGLLISFLFAEAAAGFGFSSVIAGASLAAAATVLSFIYAWATRPATLTLARTIDARANLSDLLVSAIDGPATGMRAVIRRSGLSALDNASPARVYPFTLPPHWRRWLIAAGVVQLAALPLAFQSPATRVPQTQLTALALPSAAGSNSNSTASPAAPGEKASAPAETTPSAALKSAGTSPRGVPTGEDHPGNGAPSPVRADGDRLRLSAANAAAEIASGRVPLARRGIVEKYFANIQSHRKQPR